MGGNQSKLAQSFDTNSARLAENRDLFTILFNSWIRKCGSPILTLFSFFFFEKKNTFSNWFDLICFFATKLDLFFYRKFMHFGFRLHAVHSPRSTNKYSVVCMEANGISEQTIKLYYCNRTRTHLSKVISMRSASAKSNETTKKIIN